MVNRYKYLGVVLTPRLSFLPHLEDRVSQAKIGINRVWSNFILNRNVPLSSKYRVFGSISRAVVCYGAQVWGFQSYDVLEKFQRFFIRKLFSLPSSSPNYMLAIETAMEPLECFTLHLHLKYCLKVLSLPDCRLPKKVALEVIKGDLTGLSTGSPYHEHILANLTVV